MHSWLIPASLSLKAFRSYVGPTRFELRPLTLLYGLNNAGKSALLRALPLIADSVGPDASGPLHLESAAAGGCAFNDLRWKGGGDDDPTGIELELEWLDPASESRPGRVCFELVWFEEWRRVVIRTLQIWRDDGADDCAAALTASWVPRREERTHRALSYRLERSGVVDHCSIVFEGLAPAPGQDELPQELQSIGERLRGLKGAVQWLRAVRVSPQRMSKHPSAPRWRVAPDGSDAGAALATHPEILHEVSQ